MELHSNKTTKAGIGKSLDQGHIRKQQQSKLRGNRNNRNNCIKSKAGFTLYSEPSGGTKSTKCKTQKTLINAKDTEQQDEKEIEEQFPQNTDMVVSQMQMQAELLKEKMAKSIIIPAADFESDADSTGDDNFALQEFGTAFNKRLVSSTPDPERLLEAELLKNQKSLSSMMYPQIIPERDTNIPIKTSAMVASSLSEKLKLQRQKHQQQSFQNQKQYQQLASSGQYFENNLLNHHPPVPDSELTTNVTLPFTVTKAEWVAGVVEHQNMKRSTHNSKKRLPKNSSKWPSISQANDKFSVEGTTNPDTDCDNKNVKIALPIKTKPDMLPSDLDSGLHTINLPDKIITSNMPLSHSCNDNLNKFSLLKHQKLTNETSDRESDYFNTKDNYEASVHGAIGFEKPGSAFSKPDVFAWIINQNDNTSTVQQSTRKAFTELNVGTAESVSLKPKITKGSVTKEVTKKFINDKLSEQDNCNSTLTKTKETNESYLEKINEDSGIGNTHSSVKLQVHHNEARSMDDIRVSPTERKISVVMNEDSVPDDLDKTGDTCDIEVTVICEQKGTANIENKQKVSLKLNETSDSTNEENMALRSSTSDSANLSQVIEFLKNDAFNKVKEVEIGGKRFIDEDRMDVDSVDVVSPNTNLQVDGQQPGDNMTLGELMRQYLPETDQDNVNNNSIKSCFLNDIEKQDKNSSCDKTDLEVNVNQNHLNDEGNDHQMESPMPQKNLRYLERMADSTLRDIACRLALKATALRDVELRDLIDDMIFHTDAALSREDVRSRSTQMFFIEENNKLKKRIQNINQQLDAKERQERMGANGLGLAGNDVLHLEKKIMILTQEKGKLDNHVTTLLEEKAKWLMTQQELVRTISLKDHEILRLEGKHRDEQKSLHHSLDQATKNSQGVHYKLSAADREVSNLEQTIRSKNKEIMNLKDRVVEIEDKLMECERHSKLKDQEVLHLQDLVDAIKIGVDHVLKAYESSSSKDAATDNQRQGIENLRQMVHPEEYSTLLAPGDIPQVGKRTISGQDSHHQEIFSSSQRASVPIKSHTKRSFIEPDDYSARHYPLHRHHPVEDTNHRASHCSQHKPRNGEEQGKPRHLTFEALEEHNRHLSPVDRTLWRSLDDAHRVSRVLGKDPYYSDSEIEIHSQRQRRRSNRYHQHTADTPQRHSNIHHFGHPQRPTPKKAQQHPSEHKNNGGDDLGSDTTLYSTLRSETIPKSLTNQEENIDDIFSDNTLYSTLRSEPLTKQDFVSFQDEVHNTYKGVSKRDDLLPKDHHQLDSRRLLSHRHERNPTEITLTHETSHQRPLSSSHSYVRHSHENKGVLQPLLNDYEHASARSVPRHSRNLNDQETNVAEFDPENFAYNTRGSSHHYLRKFPHADIEVNMREELDQHTHRNHQHHLEHPVHSTTRSSHEQHRRLSRSLDNAMSYRRAETHFRDSQKHLSFSGQTPDLSDRSSFLDSASTDHVAEISVSRRATRDSDNMTQREFFHGTELSVSLSSISEDGIQMVSSNELTDLNENPFLSGIAALDEKIANLQRKIDRTKAMFS